MFRLLGLHFIHTQCHVLSNSFQATTLRTCVHLVTTPVEPVQRDCPVV